MNTMHRYHCIRDMTACTTHGRSPIDRELARAGPARPPTETTIPYIYLERDFRRSSMQNHFSSPFICENGDGDGDTIIY